MPFREIISSTVFLAEQISIMQTQVAEKPPGQCTPASTTSAAPDASMQTGPTSPATPPAQPPAQADTASAASTPSNAPSDQDPAQPRPLPKDWRPRLWPQLVHCELKSREKRAEEALAEDTVRLDYELVLRGGREEVVRIKSQLVLPLALEVENLAQTDISFPALVDQVIVRPLVTKFRGFLQKRFDAASAAEAKKRSEAEPPPTSSLPANNIKLSKPTNGVPYKVPDMSAKLPTARMPGGYSTLKD